MHKQSEYREVFSSRYAVLECTPYGQVAVQRFWL
jgi:hypothetical protein